jgi:RNase P protein component
MLVRSVLPGIAHATLEASSNIKAAIRFISSPQGRSSAILHRSRAALRNLVHRRTMAYKTQLRQQLEPEHDSVTAVRSYSGDRAENQWTRTKVVYAIESAYRDMGGQFCTQLMMPN